MGGAVELTTERLVLRQVTRGDLPMLVELNADEAVMRHISATFTPQRTREWVEQMLDNYPRQPGLGWWMAEQRSDGAAIGLAALKKLSPANLEALGSVVAGRADEDLMEFGWRFRQGSWGQGYASETGRALVAKAFEQHGFPRICAVALIANAGSCRAIEKCGLQAMADYEIGGRAARLFELSQADWREQR